jgi:hypothetical protein
MKSIIVSATRNKYDYETILLQSLLPLKDLGLKFDRHIECENTDGLPVVYNRAIDTFVSNYDCIIFVHDDVYIDDGFIFDKIEAGFNEGYDIIGAAGGINPVIKSPTLWHLMCGPGNLRGAVGHFSENNDKIYTTSFGPVPSRVVLLDGLFLAVNCKRILEVNWKFNKNYDFHLYDIASSLDANAKKLKLGVLPIHLIHKSPGLSNINDETFQRNQAKFLKEYQ